MSYDKFIARLQSSELYAECKCGEEFKLSDAILFDGRGVFPEDAESRRNELLEELKERMDKLKKRKISADIGAEKRAIAIGIGKIIEKVVPAYKEFKMPLCDCRPLFDPIDYIVFSGMSEMKVQSVTFLEVKTGDSDLEPHERMVRDAVDGKKIFYKAI